MRKPVKNKTFYKQNQVPIAYKSGHLIDFMNLFKKKRDFPFRKISRDSNELPILDSYTHNELLLIASQFERIYWDLKN